MKPKPTDAKQFLMLLAAGFFLACTANLWGQVQTSTTTTEGPGVKQVEVQRGEVVYVSGNDLIVKMENGEMKDINNIPDYARVWVDGRQLSINEVKVGMKLEKTVTTTTTPRIVTQVETVSGKVFHVSPPHSVILTLENNENQKFTVPPGQEFNIDGQMVDVFGLRKGMRVTVTRVTESPETVQTMELFVSGKMPPPPPPPLRIPVVVLYQPTPLLALAPPPARVETAAATPTTLPRTGSELPVIALLGVLMLSLGLGLRRIWTID